jgi:hypothetical protein
MFSKPRSPIPPHPYTFCHLLCGLLIAFSAVAPPRPVLAQSAGGAATITAVDTGAFPDINVYLAVSDAAGNHLPGLLASAFALTEDTAALAGLKVSEQEVGTRG